MSTVLLSHWSVTSSGDPYTAPELRIPILQGTCFNHPEHADRTFVNTSRPLGKTKDGLVVTRNRVYELGIIHPHYERAFPDARQRLLESLPLVDENDKG